MSTFFHGGQTRARGLVETWSRSDEFGRSRATVLFGILEVFESRFTREPCTGILTGSMTWSRKGVGLGLTFGPRSVNFTVSFRRPKLSRVDSPAKP